MSTPKVTVRRERIETMVAGRIVEVLGDWHVLSDDFGIRVFASQPDAFKFAFSNATLSLMFQKGLIR